MSRLVREDIHSSLQPVRGMASPQLGWTWNLASASISVCGASLRTSPPSEMSALFERQALIFLCFVFTHILSHVEPGTLLTPDAVKASNISKATIHPYISNLSPHWDDEQLEAVVSMFKAHGLL